MRGGFASTFGRDPAWWLTLIVVLAVLATGELGYRAIKRSVVVMGLWRWGWKWLSWATWRKVFRGGVGAAWSGDGVQESVEEWGVEIWQEMERDPDVRMMLRKMAHGEVEEGEPEEVLGQEERDTQGCC